MTYWLGIDLGTTFITAAICRAQAGRRAQLEVVPLGTHAADLRSVVYLGQDGQVAVGDAAERRAAADPDRVVRELKRHLGEEAPMLIGGVLHPAPGIAAAVFGWVVDRVAQKEGAPARGVTITHPANWNASTIQALADALSAVPLPKVTFCTEPEAVAAAYSTREWMEIGSAIAVYDLGGGTCDAAVLRKTGDRTFATLGIPEGIQRLGGAAFDDAVFGHVLAAVPAVSELKPNATGDGPLQRSLALCRRECTEAKEVLSAGIEVTIPVLLPQIQSQVHLTRAEFEDLIYPQVAETVQALRRTLRSAEVTPEDLDTVLLVGGSARIPLVAQLLSAELGRPVAVDPDPHAAIALGAAGSGAAGSGAAGSGAIVSGAIVSGPGAGGAHPATASTSMDVGPDVPVPAPVEAGFDVPQPATTQLPPWVAADAPDAEPSGVQPDRTGSPRFTKFAAAGLLVLGLAGGAVAVPMLTAHRGPVSEPAAVIPAPRSPVPQIPVPETSVAPPPEAPVAPVAAIPDPETGSNQNPLNEPPVDAAATTPDPPAAPLGTTAKPRTATQHTGSSRGSSRSQPPAATSPPPPPAHVPDWVQSARSDP